VIEVRRLYLLIGFLLTNDQGGDISKEGKIRGQANKGRAGDS